MKDPGSTIVQPVPEVERLRRRVAYLEESEARHQLLYADLLASKEQCQGILDASPS